MSKASGYTNRLDQAAEESYKPTATTSLRAALDECNREMHVRLRIYPSWISKGTLSFTDAEDRGNRLETAVVLLQWLHDGISDLAAGKITPDQFAGNAQLLGGAS